MYLVLRARRHGAGARARRAAAARSGCSGAPRTRAATAPASTSRATSPPSTAPTTAAWSSSAARARWSSATCPLRGWVNGIGGCPNVGGICMACTMPGFPDKYMPFMDEDPVGQASRRTSRSSPTGRSCSCVPQPQHQAQVTTRSPSGGTTRPELTTGYAEALVDGARDEWQWPPETPRPSRRSSSRRCRGIRSPGSSGSLGIHTEIDFTNQQVLKCYSTSMIFRGFDIFMKGIDPRDAHFITSRICGICGDNHCTCSCLNQNMAYGVKPPTLGDYAFNLAESADFMFDHAIFNDCMANVDYCEQMVKETNPALLKKAEETPAPHADIHGYKTIADIMRALNAVHRRASTWRRCRWPATRARCTACSAAATRTRRRSCRAAAAPTSRTRRCTDYYVRLMRYMDYCKRTRADARRPLRLLLRGAAGVRAWSATATPTSCAGARSTTRTTSTTTTAT